MKSLRILALLLLSFTTLHLQAGSSFGGSFLGGFTGSVVGNVISQPRSSSCAPCNTSCAAPACAAPAYVVREVRTAPVGEVAPHQEVRALRQKIADVEEKNDSLKQKNKKLQLKIEKLEEKISKLEENIKISTK